MNRIILIGNGFDLAHKLKTSYRDFICDYISKSVNNFFHKNVHVDPLMEIKCRFSNIKYHDSHHNSQPETAIKDLESLNKSEYYHVNIKSSFLFETLKKVGQINWVDLENDYFEELLKYKNKLNFDFEKVRILNEEFEYLKTCLEEYLHRYQTENREIFNDEYSGIFCETIEGNDIVTINMADERPSRVMLLSFNYTDTLEHYLEECSKRNQTEVIYIHGQLKSKTNPLIFGFGDEYDKNYLEFEDIKNKELLKHIKSFGYFKTSNYHNLTRFLDVDNFQVYVFGHSLGLSDRTMLKQIFEHEKCRSVKIFYHEKEDGSNDYVDKTYDISSHFSDKIMMRKKIVPFDKSIAMPQARLVFD